MTAARPDQPGDALRRIARICLVTPAHLAANPRLVKEADALAEAGYGVQVVACQYLEWASAADVSILRRARWQADLLCWRPSRNPYLFWKSRLRQHASRRLLRHLFPERLWPHLLWLVLRAYDRVIPELLRRAISYPADLYIAHNLQALPVAIAAARRHNARVGFDAEDFHSGMGLHGERPTLTDHLTPLLEQTYLCRCDYITAASPLIAEAYADRYGIPRPVPILNVFPVALRPAQFRPTEHDGPLRLYWFSQTVGARRGLEDVIQAMGQLRDYPLELHLTGTWQPGYRERVLQLARASAVPETRIVVHGPVPPDELVREAALYDVGLALEQPVCENREICLTNKIFTYLLAGNAVVATATRAQAQLMSTLGVAGFIYPPGDICALREHLAMLCADRGLLDRARRAAWELGSTEYNWDREKARFLEVVDRALDSDPRQPCTASRGAFSTTCMR